MNDLTGRTLGHYRIVEKIGEGGMGVVYRARDERLDRDVAIKVLHEEVAADPRRIARFETEAKAVAKLAHPNILEIWDFGTEDGLTYSVTELLEGEDLRQRIPSSGLGWKKVVEIGAAIADGLAAAHNKGITHRDLKPENIFITSDGRVKILDFGLAQVKQPVDEEAETATLTPAGTIPGTVMGTVGYMSPEQVRGKPADARSDIFALGCVLHEMLTGKMAFARESNADTQAAILQEDPPPIASIIMALPAELERAVTRCLEKSPESRFQSASDLAYSLRSITSDLPVTESEAPNTRRRAGWVAAISIACLAAVLSAVWFFRSETVDPPLLGATLPRIAVLPFENLGLAEDEFFTDGMTDEVRGKLSRLAGLEVIARDSCDHYRATTMKPREIANELGVGYLLTAKVRWQNVDGGPSRIRLSSELVDVGSGGPPVAMWHETFDAAIDDVFQVQTDVATRVVGRLQIVLGTEGQQNLEKTPTTEFSAYEAYLQAKQLPERGPTAFQKEALLLKAVEIDPGFASAWAELSVTQSDIFWFAETTPAREDMSRRSAQQALDIDSTLPEARYAMGWYFLWVAEDLEKAESQVKYGLDSAPNSPLLLMLRARITRENPGKFVEATGDLRRAMALDPMSSYAAYMLGSQLLNSRELEEAEQLLDRALLIDPGLFSAIRCKAMVSLARGDLNGAREVLRRAIKNVDQEAFIAYLAILFDLYWVLDETWQKQLFDLDEESWGGMRGDRYLALAHTSYLRGDHRSAPKWAEQALAVYENDLVAFPNRTGLNSLVGVSLAYQGRAEEAISHGRRGLRIHGREIVDPYRQLTLVRILILLDEYEDAIELLEPLLEVPFYLTPGWLSIDPMFDPLRDHPRFQALLE